MRIAFIHTGAVVIPTIAELSGRYLPGVDVQHLLDSTIVADLARDAAGTRVADRLVDLGRAAAAAGAQVVVFSCSSISGLAAPTAEAIGIPVLRIDEAMADEAVRRGSRVAVLATLPTTLVPTAALLRERAQLAGRDVVLSEVLVEGAFEAVGSGDRARHDALVGSAIEAAATTADVVVLAQASMAGAAQAVHVDVPVLTSPELGVQRLAQVLAA